MTDGPGTPPDKPAENDPVGRMRTIPRYRSIANVVRRDIQAGIHPPGSMLPSEADLATRYGVTRMTVRQALAGLASEGLIERRHGHGTIVVPIKHQRQPEQTLGLTAELLARGIRPGSKVLKVQKVRPSTELRDQLWLGARGTVTLVRRLRYGDGALIGLQETVIPSRHAPGLELLDMTDRSLAAILRERYGLAASWTELTIEAVAADKATASVLDILPGVAVLRATSVGFLADGRPLDHTIGWFPGTRYSYRLGKVLVATDRDGKQGPPGIDEPPQTLGVLAVARLL